MVPKPVAAKDILNDNYAHAYHHGVSDAQQTITSQSIATEDETADDGLQ